MREKIIEALTAYRIERGSGVSEPLRAVDVHGIADAVLGALGGEPVGDAAGRVRRYLDRLKRSRQHSQEDIHAFDVGEPSEAVLLGSDLRVLIWASGGVLATALVGFNASAEGFNGECAYKGLEPDETGRRQNPVELDDPSQAFVIRNLERHLAAAGFVDGPQ